jgi:glycosyltransferase involved in cell wall biosynthesis
VVTIHDLTLSFFPGKKMTSFLHRIAYQAVIRSVTRKAKKIIAVSQNTKKDIISLLGIPDEKIEVIYNGVGLAFDINKITKESDLMEKFGLKKPFFIYTGVWRDHKNLVGMIKAFASFNAKANKAYSLVITGAPSATYHEVPDIIRDLRIEENVHLVGLVSEEDLASLYQHALCYVFPSFYEGFGLPPLEAMAFGLPVIASNTSATPEACGEGNALFFDPYSLDDMEEKMQMISSDPALRVRLVERGRQRVKEFGWGKMTEAVLGVYSSFTK